VNDTTQQATDTTIIARIIKWGFRASNLKYQCILGLSANVNAAQTRGLLMPAHSSLSQTFYQQLIHVG
jgi:hypothetical protein